jgi:hypothetical protein
VGACGADQETVALGDLDHRAAQRDELLAGGRDALARRRRDLEHGLHQLRLHLPVELGRDRREQHLDLLGEVEALGVEDHQLLLDADRERGAGEAVFEHVAEGFRGAGSGASQWADSTRGPRLYSAPPGG